MKEPRRLLSQGATDFERQLLRAAVSERPSAPLRSRMQRGLGLVGPLAWASNAKAALGQLAAKLTPGLLVGGVVAAAAVTGAALWARDSGEVVHLPAAAPSAEVVAAEPPAAVAPPALGAPASSVGEAAALKAAALEAPAAEAPALEAPALDLPAAEAAGDDDSRLREEIALLDAARAALQRGDREGARASLRTYRERFPEGVLAREARVLRRRADGKRPR